MVFYRTESGVEPVREWLKGLNREDRKVIGEDIKTVQFAWPLGMPLVRKIEPDLWEARSHLPRRRISRVLFTVDSGAMVLLHGFLKQSQKIEQPDVELARERKAKVRGTR